MTERRLRLVNSGKTEKGPKRINEDELQKFHERLHGFTPEAQEIVSDLSSFCVEPDVHQDYQDNPEKVEVIAVMLKEQGVSEEDVGRVMDFFNLPYSKTPDSQL